MKEKIAAVAIQQLLTYLLQHTTMYYCQFPATTFAKIQQNTAKVFSRRQRSLILS